MRQSYVSLISTLKMPTQSTWWRHQTETFSVLLAICAGISPVPGEFPAQRPETRSFGVFFDLRLNKRLHKQSWGWWFETPSRPLWRHCNEMAPWYSVPSMYHSHYPRGTNNRRSIARPHIGAVMWGFLFSRLLSWTVCWTNSGIACALRHHNVHKVDQCPGCDLPLPCICPLGSRWRGTTDVPGTILFGKPQTRKAY